MAAKSKETGKKGDNELPEKKKILITSALPYVNNVPHLGNIIGAVLSADVFARFSRSYGNDTLFVCGTDEHGTTTEAKAAEEGLSPKEVCDKYYKIHKEIYDWFSISFDIFGRSSDPVHHEFTQKIFLKLYEKGLITENKVKQFYCRSCDVFLADRFIEGTCPHCGYEDARGDQCDRCGKLLEPTELKKPRCKRCSSAPELVETEHLFLDLGKLQPKIERWFDDKSKTGDWRDNSIRITKAWFKEGLTKRCITRDLKWGIPVPLEKYRNKVFYVWFDAPIAYISMTKSEISDWKDWWMQDGKSRAKLYQFMGKDNVPFHSIIFPGTLLGTEDPYTTVHHIDSTEYLNYEDSKFSKSRGTGVFGDDAMNTRIPPDVWRYYLISQRPENSDTVFSWDDLKSRTNNELIANFANLVNRTLMFIDRFFDSKVPRGEPDDEDMKFLSGVKKKEELITDLLLRCEEREALREVIEVSRLGNQYLQREEPWKKIKENKEEAGKSLYVLANIVKDLAILIEPFLPDASKKMFEMLNIEPLAWDMLSQMTIEQDHGIKKTSVLFSKIEDKDIESYREMFGNQDMNKAGSHDDCQADPFSLLDIRVGKVEDISEHEDSDKLYVLKVSLGKETRQIVAGLRPYIPKEDILGRNVVIVANLEPRKLRGVVSEGMVLAASAKQDGKGIVRLLDASGCRLGEQVTAEGTVQAAKESISYDEFSRAKMTTKGRTAVYNGKHLKTVSGAIKADIADNARVS